MKENKFKKYVSDNDYKALLFFSEKYIAYDMGEPKWRVLTKLYVEEQISQKNLPIYTGLAKNHLNKIIENLEKEGLINYNKGKSKSYCLSENGNLFMKEKIGNICTLVDNAIERAIKSGPGIYGLDKEFEKDKPIKFDGKKITIEKEKECKPCAG